MTSGSLSPLDRWADVTLWTVDRLLAAAGVDEGEDGPPAAGSGPGRRVLRIRDDQRQQTEG